MSSSAQTTREIIKQTVILVYIGTTVLIGSGMIRNYKNSFKHRVHLVWQSCLPLITFSFLFPFTCCLSINVL